MKTETRRDTSSTQILVAFGVDLGSVSVIYTTTNLHNNSQLPLNPLPEDHTPSSGIVDTRHTFGTHTCKQTYSYT